MMQKPPALIWFAAALPWITGAIMGMADAAASVDTTHGQLDPGPIGHFLIAGAACAPWGIGGAVAVLIAWRYREIVGRVSGATIGGTFIIAIVASVLVAVAGPSGCDGDTGQTEPSRL